MSPESLTIGYVRGTELTAKTASKNRRAASRGTTEHGTARQPGPAWVVMIKQSADHFSSNKQTRDRDVPVIFGFRLGIDLDSPEREGDSGSDRIGLEWGALDSSRPVGLGNPESNRAATVFEARIEGVATPGYRVVELLYRSQEPLAINSIELCRKLLKAGRLHSSTTNH